MKQVILVRNDLQMSPGKAAAQVAHAAMLFLLKALKDNVPVFSENELQWMFSEKGQFPEWEYGGLKKIVLAVDNLDKMLYYHRQAKLIDLKSFYVYDEGLKAFTACAIGPDFEEKIDVVTGRLPLYGLPKEEDYKFLPYNFWPYNCE